MDLSASDSSPNVLWKYGAHQQQRQVHGVRVGGDPGVRPTVLIGSLFYHGQDLVQDEDAGEFDHDRARACIQLQTDYAQRTGNPCMLDIVGATAPALQRHLQFAAQCSDVPLLLDGTTAEVRLEALEFVAAVGLADRVVYNSIQPGIPDDELAAVERAGVRAAVVLTYYLPDFTIQGRLQAVRELLPRVQDAGIETILVDTCVLDLATMGQAMGALYAVKDQFGLPAGGGVHNAVAMWRGLKSKLGRQAYHPCVAAACASAVALGADFVLYGPVEDAPIVFPAVAMMDTALSQAAMEAGAVCEPNHPRFRIG